MSRTFSLSLLAVLATAGTAAAAPTVVIDPTELRFNLLDTKVETDKSVTGKYYVTAQGRIVANQGQISSNDRLTLTWSAGGKPLTSIECELRGEGGSAPFTCRGDAKLDTYGAITAEFSLAVDADDSVLTVSTHQLKVGRFWNWFARNSKRGLYAKYQVVPLDLLTSAVIWLGEYNGERRVYLYGHVSGLGAEPYKISSLRCTVDGKKVPDIEAGAGETTLVEGNDWPVAEKDARVAQVRRFSIWLGGAMRWGTVDELPEHERADLEHHRMLADSPGRWECDLRAKGKVIRQLAFTVTADGRLAPHPEQAAGLTLPLGEYMLDVTIPESAPDPFVEPAASKASGFWGQPWRDAATGARLAPSFTRAGFEPTPPKGAKGGTAAKPAKPVKPAKRRGK